MLVIQRWHKSLFHCALALPIQAAAWQLGAWESVVVVAAWFHAREVVQHQYAIKGEASTSTVWYKGWFPFEWDKWSVVDFIAPVITSALIAILWGYVK